MSLTWLARGLAVALLLGGLGFASNCSAQDDAQQVELLKAKLELAEKTLQLLEKECEELRKEVARLKGEKGEKVEPVTDANDQFRVGVVWLGEARTGKSEARVHWALSVSGRDGNKLDGVVALVMPDGKKIEYPVSGTAPATGNGLVILESPVVGRAQMYMRGRLNNGEVALAFSATTRLGEKRFGSATLRPKN